MNPALIAMLLLGYGIGLINASWLLHRLVSGNNLQQQGSGNLGARNLYDVSGKLWLAILAALFDVAKGAGAVLIAATLHPTWYAAAACAGVGVVVGHNYNFLLKWNGGRGLATAAGVIVVVCPPFLITWLLMYAVGYGAIRKNLHVACMTATIATAVMALSVPSPVLSAVTMLPSVVASQMRWTIVALAFPIFLRFIDPVRAFIMQETESDEQE